MHNNNWCLTMCKCNNKELEVRETFVQSSKHGLVYTVHITNNTTSVQRCSMRNFFLSMRAAENNYHEVMSAANNALQAHKPQTKYTPNNISTPDNIATPASTSFGNPSDGWVGFTQLYWVFAAQALHAASYTPIEIASQDHSMNLSGWQATSEHAVEPGTSKQLQYRFFFGPQTQAAMLTSTEFAQIDKTIDLGYFAILLRPLFNLIVKVAEHIGVEYIAHVLLAIAMLVRTALCNRYGWLNIKEMEKFAGDPARMMAIARKWFANTLAQFATSLALYKICFVLPEATVYGIGWIRNLNVPDGYYLLNGYLAGWNVLSITTLLCIIITLAHQATERSLSGQAPLDRQTLMMSCIMLIMDRTSAILGLLYLANTFVAILYNCLLLVRRRRFRSIV